MTFRGLVKGMFRVWSIVWRSRDKLEKRNRCERKRRKKRATKYASVLGDVESNKGDVPRERDDLAIYVTLLRSERNRGRSCR